MSQNFPATSAGGQLAVTAASGPATAFVTLLGAPAARVQAAQDVLIDNRGSFDAYVLFGSADQSVAASTGVRVPAGSLAIYGKGSSTHVAAIGDGATTLVMHLGEGV